MPPGQKPLRERPVENPDFAGVLILVRPMAINYSFWPLQKMFSRQLLKHVATLIDGLLYESPPVLNI